jgi:hypothetical protein
MSQAADPQYEDKDQFGSMSLNMHVLLGSSVSAMAVFTTASQAADEVAAATVVFDATGTLVLDGAALLVTTGTGDWIT